MKIGARVHGISAIVVTSLRSRLVGEQRAGETFRFVQIVGALERQTGKLLFLKGRRSLMAIMGTSESSKIANEGKEGQGETS